MSKKIEKLKIEKSKKLSLKKLTQIDDLFDNVLDLMMNYEPEIRIQAIFLLRSQICEVCGKRINVKRCRCSFDFLTEAMMVKNEISTT